MTTPREEADACCDSCRSLVGDGPWCPRCGNEMPGEVPSEDQVFTNDVCAICDGTPMGPFIERNFVGILGLSPGSLDVSQYRDPDKGELVNENEGFFNPLLDPLVTLDELQHALIRAWDKVSITHPDERWPDYENLTDLIPIVDSE